MYVIYIPTLYAFLKMSYIKIKQKDIYIYIYIFIYIYIYLYTTENSKKHF